MSDKNVTMTIHFMDGSKIVVQYPKQAGADSVAISNSVRKALEWDKIPLEIEESLIVIPTQNIKYIQVTPKPVALPNQDVLKGAMLVE
jgi:hypothetical protein